MVPLRKACPQVNRMQPHSLPFKGRAGVGMGYNKRKTLATFYPIPLPASPLKGEEVLFPRFKLSFHQQLSQSSLLLHHRLR